MTVRSILLASLFAAVAVPAVAQDYQYGSGYGSDYDQRRDSVYASDRREIRSVIEFEIPLARYGRWVASRYGRAWSPRVGRDWRPYTVGRWVDTEDGRVWDSSEPWGWATYHYGRWGFDDRYGWVWVPGLEWAPAWVAFRDGDDYAGWAPLPPQVGYDYDVDAWDYQRWYEPSWVYVPRASFYSGRIGGAILPWRSNRNYWDRTRQRQFDGRPGSGRADRDGRPGYGNRPGGDNRPGNDGRPGRPALLSCGRPGRPLAGGTIPGLPPGC